MKTPVLIVLLVSAAWAAKYPRSVVKVLSTSNGTPWGPWGRQDFCPTGTYAVAFRQKVERPCGKCDDTAMNAIELKCGHPNGRGHYGTLRSSEGPWGSFNTWQECLNIPNNRFFLSQFRLDVEPHCGRCDDTGANNVNMQCRPLRQSYKYELQGNSPAPWGKSKVWSATCPLGTAICGLQTKVEPRQGKGDDTALNDIRLFCCRAS